MTRFFSAVVALLLAVPAAAQEPTVQLETRGTSGTITANGGAVTLTNTGGLASLLIQTSGTFDTTWELQCAADSAGTAFDADDEVPVTQVSSTPSAVDQVTNDAEALYTANIAGCTAVRVIATAYASGTQTVVLQAITSGGGSGGGGGGGSTFNGVLKDAAGGDDITDTTNNALNVNCVIGCDATSVALADDADFTDGTTPSLPVGGVAESATPTTVTEGDHGTFAMTLNRALKTSLYNAAGTAAFGTAGTAATPVLTVQGIASMTALTVSATNLDVQIGGSDTLAVGNVATIGTSVTPGTSAAHLGKAEDAVAASGDTGVMALGVRADTAAATAANGDYVPILMDSIGRQWITGADVEDAAATAGGSLLMIGCVRQDTAASSSGTSGDNSNCTTDANGRMYSNIFGVTQAAGTYITVRLSDGSNFLTPSTDSTHDSAIGTTGPAIMGEATTAMTSDTAVADGDATRLKADTNGRMLSLASCPRQDRVRGQATITDGSSTSVLAALGANIIAEIYEIEIANSSATTVTVDMRDGTGGSVLWTLIAPATGGNNRTFTVPLTFTANTAVAADPSASASSIIVSVLGCRVL